MPEIPDVEVYVAALRERLVGRAFESIELISPFVLRTVDPPIAALVGEPILAITRLGKRIVFQCDGERYLIVHLMVAGRLRWREGVKRPGVKPLARFAVGDGSLWLTEASTRKRASLHVVAGEAAVEAFDRGGLEVQAADFEAFHAAMTRENRTLKRALTDPRILSGIGNAYSDEILFAARLSPVVLTSRLDREQAIRLFEATRDILTQWTVRLRQEVGDGFPEKVTAFRKEMAVHGRYREPCRVCEAPIQRIRYASNECNYCAKCQNAGRLLADRGLSQLMRKDWPKTLEELDELRSPG